MNRPKAFGAFVKRGDYTFRTSAYIQWGESEKSIGSCLLLNPGSADFDKINSNLTTSLNTLGNADGEVNTDQTMKQLIKVVEGIYGTETPINGRFHIYNLFNLQNTENRHAIEQFENLVDCGEYDITSSLIPIAELKSHPWIFFGWGVERNRRWKNLEHIKESWRELISESNIPLFGKKHRQTDDYYHPLYILYQPSMLQELATIYKQKFGKQRFPVYATKPNLLIDPIPVENYDEFDFGWFRTPANPESIVMGFSHLRIKDGYKLRAYQYMEGVNGNGVVWAIPVDKALPDSNECERLEEHFLSAPKPAFAMDDFMQGIDGDKTPFPICKHPLHFMNCMNSELFGMAYRGVEISSYH